MPEKRPATLLEFAIAASVAVVPLLLVGAGRRGRSAAGGSRREGASATAISTSACARSRRSRRSSAPSFAATRSRSRCRRPKRCSTAFRSAVREWDGRGGTMHRIRRLLARAGQAPLSPAQRMAAQFEELDAALRRFSTGANRRVGDAVGFDARRWFDARARRAAGRDRIPRVPRTQVHWSIVRTSRAPSRRSRAPMAGCWARSRGAAPSSTGRWRTGVPSSTSRSRRGRSRAEIPGAACPAASTWGFAPDADVAGPEYFVAGTRDAAAAPVQPVRNAGCRQRPIARPRARPGSPARRPPEMPVDDLRWNVPPSLAVMLQPLATLQRPTGSLYRLYTDAPPTSGATPTSLSLRSQSHRHRRNADRRRLFDRSHHRARRCRRWRSGRPPATPGARTSAGRWDCSAARTRHTRSAIACSSMRSSGWRPSR